MKNVIKGNLISLARAGHFDVIVHGCNCYNNMGKGIALDIKRYFPDAYSIDCTTVKGDKSKLGTFTGVACYTKKQSEVFIVNAYTQFDYWSKGVLVDYDAVEKIFTQIAKDFKGLHIAYPAIGAGLAMGDWDRISSIIDKALDGMTHTFVEWDGSKTV